MWMEPSVDPHEQRALAILVVYRLDRPYRRHPTPGEETNSEPKAVPVRGLVVTSTSVGDDEAEAVRGKRREARGNGARRTLMLAWLA